MVELPLMKALFSGKTYTGPAFMADMDTGHEESLMAVVDHVCARTGTPRVLEVGSWLGGMTVQLAKLFADRRNDPYWTCVENFQAPLEMATRYPRSEDAMMEFYADAASQDILKNLFRHNMKRCLCEVTLIEGQMLETLSGMQTGSFDLVVLHGTRALTQFAEMYAECRRLLAEGGVLCGTGLELRKEEVDESVCNHGYAFRHTCFAVYDEKSGKRYYPEITAVLSGELDDMNMSNNGFWTTSALTLPRESGETDSNGQTGRFDIFPYHDQFAVLHKSVGRSRIGSERLGERRIPGVFELAATETEARERAAVMNERQLRLKGSVVEETKHYYVCKYGERTYLAQCKMNKFPQNFRIFMDRVGDYEMAPTLLTGNSLAELKQKVAAHEAVLDIKAGWHPIQERFNGYYLYATHEDYCVAVNMDMVHGRPFVDMIGQEDLAPYVLTGPDTTVLKQRIEHLRKREKTTDGASIEPEEWL